MSTSMANAPVDTKMVTAGLQQVFVSYSWRNANEVTSLIEDLATMGFSVATTDGGRADAARLAEGIEASSVVIAAFSNFFNDSKSCRAEVAYANEQNKPIVGIKLEKNWKPDGWLAEIFNSTTTTTIIDLTSPTPTPTSNGSHNINKQLVVDRLATEIHKQSRIAQEQAESVRIKAHPIFDAAKLGDADDIRAIIASCGDYLLDEHNPDEIGDMPIHRAARYGRTEAMALLLQLGSNIQLQNKRGASALHVAAFMGHIGSVRHLVEKAGANFRAVDHNGWLPLHCAAAQGHLEVVEYLLEKAPDTLEMVTGDEDCRSTPLLEASRNGKVKVARFLIEKGAKKDAKNSKDNNALHLAAINDFPEMAEFLLEEAGANIEERGQWGRTPLLTAAAHGSVHVAQYLLEKGADLFAHSEADSDNASTTVHLAAAAGSREILQLVYTYVFETKDFQSRTPLHRAAINGQISTASYLVSHGLPGSFDCKDVHKQTPLDLALEAEKKERRQASEVVRMLANTTKQK